MRNAVGREIPEEILRETGKEAFRGAYAFDNYEYRKVERSFQWDKIAGMIDSLLNFENQFLYIA